MTIEDLDSDAVERYLAYRAERSRNRKRLGEAAELLPALRAVARDPASGQLRPTHAGILMFGLDPQLPLPQSEVVCIKYADPLGVRRYIDRKNLRGTLPELIDQASRFIAQYTRMGATIRGFYREDEPEYGGFCITPRKGKINGNGCKQGDFPAPFSHKLALMRPPDPLQGRLTNSML